MKELIKKIVVTVFFTLIFAIVFLICYNVITIYRRPMCTVTFDTNGGTSVSNQVVKYGDFIDIPTTYREGYTFKGWYNADGTIKFRDVLHINGNKTVIAKWVANIDTPYKVEHYIENFDGGYELKETDNLVGVSDSIVTPMTKTYVGFTVPNTQDVVVLSDGTQVVKFYYTRNNYTVTFVSNGGTSVSNQVIKYGDFIDIPNTYREGYIFGGWYQFDEKIKLSDNLLINSDTTFVADWIANTDTPYKVEHYIENLDGGYELKETDNLFGKSDSIVTAMTKTYIGFTTPDTQDVVVLSDGTQVVKYYYTRNSYIVTFVTNGGDEIQSKSLKYQEILPQVNREGYTFGGWYSDVELSLIQSAVPEKNIKLYACWKEENKPSDFIYQGSNSITITKYKATDSIVRIPEYIGGIKVTSIGSSAFADCSSLISVTIGNGITSIGSNAFYACNSLVEIINKSSLNIVKRNSNYGYIAYYALEVHNGDSKIVNDNGYLFYTYEGVNYLVKYMGRDTQLTLPEKYNGESYNIYRYAFNNFDSLTSVTIGNGITSIGSNAFYACNSLVEIINKSSLNIVKGDSSNGYVAYYALEVHNGDSKIVNDNGYLFYTCEDFFYTDKEVNYLVKYIGSDTQLILPENYNGESYEIYKYAFYSCDSLTSITMGNSVTNIGSYAFYSCDNLTSVTLPDSVTMIGEEAFCSCDSLISIMIGNGVTSIGSYAFYDCDSLTSIMIGNGVTSIEKYAFAHCDSLISVTIPDRVMSIGSFAFELCSNLTSVTIGSGVKSIGDYAFAYCESLTSIKFSGIKMQWNAISKENDWNYSSGAYTVHCTDGNVSK